MAGAVVHYKQGPASYTAAGLILGGQLVTAATSGGLSGNGVVVVPHGSAPYALTLGVAASDANTGQYPEGTPSMPGNWPGDGSTTAQDELLDISILGYTVAVYNNVDINVTYDGNVSFGALLQNSSNVDGAVMVWSASNPQNIVGRCTQPGGVLSGAVGRAFIRV